MGAEGAEHAGGLGAGRRGEQGSDGAVTTGREYGPVLDPLAAHQASSRLARCRDHSFPRNRMALQTSSIAI